MKNILVMGMHRSGTSCLAGILNEAGVLFANSSKSNEFNKKGNLENPEVTDLNRRMFKSCGATWHTPKRIESISLINRFKILMLLKGISKSASQNGMEYTGLKDPRMIFTLRHWMKKNSVLIGTIRAPYKVASSLFARAQKSENITRTYSIEHWLELWYKYNSELLKIHKNRPFGLVCFDWDKEKYMNTLEHVFRTNSLKLTISENAFYAQELINQRNNPKFIDPKFEALYQELLKRTELNTI